MKIETFIEKLQKDWTEVLPIIKSEAIKTFDEKFSEIDFTTNFIEDIPKDYGIYLFEIYPIRQFDILTFQNEWKSNNAPVYSPNISKSRLYYDVNNKWYPFYIGKSEKLSNRINEHCFQDFDKTTYGLKLKQRGSLLKNCKIRFSYFTITKNRTLDKNAIQFVMTNLEREIRNEIKPWIGKQ